MSEELKQCPFCGGNPAQCGSFSDGQYGVRCSDCHCVARLGKTYEEAINLWNTRAYEAEIEELKAKLRESESTAERFCGHWNEALHDYLQIIGAFELEIKKRTSAEGHIKSLKHQLSVALDAFNKIDNDCTGYDGYHSSAIAQKAIQQIQGEEPYPLQKFRDSMKRRQDGNFDYPIEQQWSDGSWRETGYR